MTGDAGTAAEVRSAAARAARRAARRGFDSEPHADWLTRRAWVAAVRTIARSRHPRIDRLLSEWTGVVCADLGFDPADLPADGPFERIVTDHALYDPLVQLLDATLPLPDEPGGVRLWSQIGVRARIVLSGEGNSGHEFTITRVSCTRRDRWFFFWPKAQDANYDLWPPGPATASARLSQTLGWAGWVRDDLGPIHTMLVDADRRTYQRVEQAVRASWPDAIVRRLAQA